jgi:protein SCO1/2
MKRVLHVILISAITIFSSCGPTEVPKEEFGMQGIPRLAKYYGEPNENGDTIYHSIPAIELVNQHGNRFSTSIATGNVSVVQLFFTTCEGICPVISGNMTAVQKAFAGNENVKLFSLSVDPARDSVGALKLYAQRFNCDSAQWNLLTGDKKLIYDYVRHELRLPAVEEGDGGEEDFIHSENITLIDQLGIVRGYYNGTDTAQVRMLIEDIQTLIK